MQSFEKYISEYIESKGVCLEKYEMMEYIKAHELTNEIAGRWNDDIDSYPKSLLAVLILIVNHVALEWIDTNKPKAFYRPNFER